ncbi:unnamed protein product [Rhizophagus irregularis]|nr:unnamed protein product [Rhizophagus irregularis]
MSDEIISVHSIYNVLNLKSYRILFCDRNPCNNFCANSLPRRTTLLGFSTELALADDCLISLISSSILEISILGLKLNDALSQ